LARGFLALLIAGLGAGAFATEGHAETVVLDAVADTTTRTDLNARRNDNYGCDWFIVVGGSRGGGGIPDGGADGIRTLIQFDLAGIDRPVVDAKLELTVGTYFSFSAPEVLQVYNVDVHRVVDSFPLTPWIEGNGVEGYLEDPIPGCVGVDAANGVAWVGASDGGDTNNQTQPDFDPTVEASAVLDENTSGAGSVFQWDLTDLVAGWAMGAVPNFGIVLRDVTTDGTFRHVFFGAREGRIYEDVIPDDRVQDGPRLVITLGPFFPVDIDIKPGSDPNSINLSSAGVVPVAILSSVYFDATAQVDPDTVALAGASVKMVGKSGKLLCHDEDVNGDGLHDLVCKVYTAELEIELGDSTATLEAITWDGTPIRGEDSIQIVQD
jgi:hypothetical protein